MLPTTADDMRAPAVRLDGVGKRFGNVTALAQASLDVRPGELMTLLGPSGCGKTTLLNLIAGFVSPDEGNIFIAGANVNAIATYRREIGMMFQNYALFPHMSVAQNVGYGLRMRRLPRREIARRVADALDLVKLTGLAARRPRELSGGQQQRVALARALVIRPQVLLLDEPLSALDRNLRGAMQVEIKQIQKQLAVTTIFVTHDQSEALSLSDRIAVMCDGRVRQVGTPDQIYRRPCDRFVASFVGDVNVLPGHLLRCDGTEAVVVLGSAQVRVPRAMLADTAAGDVIDLFVRPEQLEVAADGAPVAARGVVAAQIYQGAHIDLHVDVVDAGRVLLRVPGPVALSRFPAGTPLRLALRDGDVVAFVPEPPRRGPVA